LRALSLSDLLAQHFDALLATCDGDFSFGQGNLQIGMSLPPSHNALLAFVERDFELRSPDFELCQGSMVFFDRQSNGASAVLARLEFVC
jgi:hypothetical protein